MPRQVSETCQGGIGLTLSDDRPTEKVYHASCRLAIPTGGFFMDTTTTPPTAFTKPPFLRRRLPPPSSRVHCSPGGYPPGKLGLILTPPCNPHRERRGTCTKTSPTITPLQGRYRRVYRVATNYTLSRTAFAEVTRSQGAAGICHPLQVRCPMDGKYRTE